MRILKVLSMTILVILMSFIPQEDFTLFLKEKLTNYSLNYPQEKIYLHFDREEYFSGENIWFKVYLLNGITHRKDSLSLVVYIDFIGDSSKVIQQKRIKIIKGVGYGNFTLDNTNDFQLLTVKAYTSWMRNYNPEFFFEKKLRIYGSAQPTFPEVKSNHDFQLLPEGGYLVSGVNNHLGFKATDKFGNGIEFTGRITEGVNTITEFAPSHAGMGSVFFNPERGKEYYAEITFHDGTTRNIQIDNIQNDYLLQVDNSKIDFLNLKILLSPDFYKPSETAWVVIQAKGEVFFMAQARLSKEEIQIPVAKFTLPKGIVQCSIFDQDGRPKGERLVFIDKPAENTIVVETNKTIYKPREETEVKLTLSDNSGRPVQGDFSLTVFDLVQVDPAGEFHFNIFDYLMLNSELSGYIESPGYYYDDENKDAAKDLDVLLMTQGWRRFVWEKILNEEKPAYTHFMEQGFSITGILFNQRGKVLSDGSISLLLDGDKSGFMTSLVNEKGVFGFYELDISDSTEIYIQAKDGKDRPDVTIKLDTLFVAPKFEITGVFFPDDEKLKTPLEDLGFKRMQIQEAFRLSSLDRVLDEVVIEGQRSKPRLARKQNQLYSVPDNRINLDDLPAPGVYRNVFQMLQGRIAGVQITGDPQNPVINIRGTGQNGTTSIQNNVDPIILVDGVQTDVSMAATIPMANVETVDVIKGLWSSMIYGGSGGMIAIYTKQGNITEARPLPGLTNFTARGYSINKEYYKPNYAEENDLAEPDYRATLHWEPMIRIDSSGTFSLKYFNSDLENEIQIQVEGVTDSGEPLIADYRYIIKK